MLGDPDGSSPRTRQSPHSASAWCGDHRKQSLHDVRCRRTCLAICTQRAARMQKPAAAFADRSHKPARRAEPGATALLHSDPGGHTESGSVSSWAAANTAAIVGIEAAAVADGARAERSTPRPVRGLEIAAQRRHEGRQSARCRRVCDSASPIDAPGARAPDRHMSGPLPAERAMAFVAFAIDTAWQHPHIGSLCRQTF